MKKKVVLELPVNIANWLLLECDFAQAMLDDSLADLDICSSKNTSLYRVFMRDYCNYGVVHNILAKSLAKLLSK